MIAYPIAAENQEGALLDRQRRRLAGAPLQGLFSLPLRGGRAGVGVIRNGFQ